MKRQNRILIVEDDANLRWGIEHHLRKLDWDVITAEDGVECLAAIQEIEAIDLIILDIMMPFKNGYQVCSQLRNDGHKMPVIMLTAKGSEADIVRGLELGADDYVTKPFSIKVLIARIEALLRRSSGPTSADYVFGEFVLDTKSHRFTKAGKAIELTTKEYGVLEYLLKNQGRALTRRQILTAVWGSSITVNTRSVDRCVTTLRGKIESLPKHPVWIHTIRDVGYRLEIP